MSAVIDFATRQSVATIEPAAAASGHPIWTADEQARIRSDRTFAAVELQRIADIFKSARSERKMAFPDEVSRTLVVLTWIQLECQAHALRRTAPTEPDAIEDAEESLERAISAAERAIERLSEARAVLRSVP